MLLVPLRWLGKNLGTLILSFLLALVVWVSAVTAANPNKENEYPRPVPIEIIGQDSDLLLMGDIPTSVKITLNAPNSVWTQLISDEHTIRAWVDLSGLGAGRHTVPVQVQVSLRPVRVVSVDPKEIGLTLEPLVTRVLTINLQVKGEPPQGYKADAPTMNPGQVSISGPDSLVSKVKEVKTTLNIAGATEKVVATLPLAAGVLDWMENGSLIWLLGQGHYHGPILVFLMSTISSIKWLLLLVSGAVIIYQLVKRTIAGRLR